MRSGKLICKIVVITQRSGRGILLAFLRRARQQKAVESDLQREGLNTSWCSSSYWTCYGPTTTCRPDLPSNEDSSQVPSSSPQSICLTFCTHAQGPKLNPSSSQTFAASSSTSSTGFGSCCFELSFLPHHYHFPSSISALFYSLDLWGTKATSPQ